MLSSEAARAEAEEGSRVLRALADWPSGDIVVSHTNVANLPFARNWFASLMRVGVPNWAIFATDEEAYEILHAEVPNHVLRWHNRARGPRGSHFAFRSKGWTRVVFAVPRMARFVLALALG